MLNQKHACTSIKTVQLLFLHQTHPMHYQTFNSLSLSGIEENNYTLSTTLSRYSRTKMRKKS